MLVSRTLAEDLYVIKDERSSFHDRPVKGGEHVTPGDRSRLGDPGDGASVRPEVRAKSDAVIHENESAMVIWVRQFGHQKKCPRDSVSRKRQSP